MASSVFIVKTRGVPYLFLLWLSVSISSCTQQENSPRKVIVVHARGISYPDLMSYLDTTKAKGFFEQNFDKNHIKKLTPINNAVTISNIASFETGTLPSAHGIIGHSYGIRSDTSVLPVSGFAQRFARPSFWEVAGQKGKKVLSIGALTMRGMYVGQSNIDLLAQGRQGSSSKLLKLIPNPVNTEDGLQRFINLNSGDPKLYPTRGSDSLVVYQTAGPSGKEELIFDDDYNIDNGIKGSIKKEQWLELELGVINGLSASFRAKWLASAGDTLTLYMRGSFLNQGFPENFLKTVDAEVGPSKGWPNIGLYANQGISAVTLLEEINTETDYIMEVFSHSASAKAYDLIIIDYPLMDRLGHAFLSERAWSGEIQDFYKTAFERMNVDFRLFNEFAKQNDYELIITSGHGFSPVHTSINLNAFLKQHNLETGTKAWEVVGIPGKTSAHLYVNGHIDTIQKESLIQKLEQIFKGFRHEQKPVVDAVYRDKTLAEIGLNHQNAGDLFIQLKPGFVFQNGADDDNVFGTPIFKGDHGYSLKHEDAFGVLITTTPCDSCHSTDIARFIFDKLQMN